MDLRRAMYLVLQHMLHHDPSVVSALSPLPISTVDREPKQAATTSSDVSSVDAETLWQDAGLGYACVYASRAA